jgi:GrpB-like predicted nucleotidyltransferase (UPF0157 family)
MILGLKGASVELVDHDPAWGTLAAQDIEELWNIFGLTAKDIQHVGSTAIHGIKAKPIIDNIKLTEEEKQWLVCILRKSDFWNLMSVSRRRKSENDRIGFVW